MFDGAKDMRALAQFVFHFSQACKPAEQYKSGWYRSRFSGTHNRLPCLGQYFGRCSSPWCRVVRHIRVTGVGAEEEEEEEEEEAGSTWFLSSPSKSCPWCSSGQSPSGLGLDLEEALEAMEGSELEATTKTVLINVSAWLPSFLYTLQHLQVCLFCPVYKSGYPKHTQEGLKLLHFR